MTRAIFCTAPGCFEMIDYEIWDGSLETDGDNITIIIPVECPTCNKRHSVTAYAQIHDVEVENE
jgi:hypothetical protein